MLLRAGHRRSLAGRLHGDSWLRGLATQPSSGSGSAAPSLIELRRHKLKPG
eukprot:COSAG01_NODE_43673_length_427_cov_1.091463_1_plen_50_part_10